jgi:hypothetical protein
MAKILFLFLSVTALTGCGQTFQAQREGYAAQCDRLGYRRGTDAFMHCFQVVGAQDAESRDRLTAAGMAMMRAGVIMQAQR